MPIPPGFAEELRKLARRYVDDGDSIKLGAICLLVADLCDQGWRVNIVCGAITFEPPGIAKEGQQSIEDVKERVRRTLQAARAKQLQEPPFARFLCEWSAVRSGRRVAYVR